VIVEFHRTSKKVDAPATTLQKLVAEACGDGDLVTALGAAAAQNGGSGLGGHANEKAVNFGAAAAVGLECALWHKVFPVD
jgi:hypothetical protein